jgi:hypothetical protein
LISRFTFYTFHFAFFNLHFTFFTLHFLFLAVSSVPPWFFLPPS